MHDTTWDPWSWKHAECHQAPNWEHHPALEPVTATLQHSCEIVTHDEIAALRDELSAAAEGDAVLLHIGDCAEDFNTDISTHLRQLLKVLLQMTVVLSWGAGKPVVKIVRGAGQYGKPRSSATETRDDITLPSFRGHIINDEAFTAAARTPDPTRMLEAYQRSTAATNMLRAITSSGYASLAHVTEWNQAFIAGTDTAERFAALAANIERAIAFAASCGLDTTNPGLHTASVHTSHEALVLDYEAALTRNTAGRHYASSGHMLWVGNRTRQLDGAHLEYLRGVANPIGVKIDHHVDVHELVAICDTLDPNQEPGKLNLISRMGANNVEAHLGRYLDAVARTGRNVVWSCDPCHANTITAANGYKTRDYDQIVAEMRAFIDTCHRHDTPVGGIHIEATGGDVTECTGGARHIGEGHLEQRYTTLCDPRLNAEQAIELAFDVSDHLTG